MRSRKFAASKKFPPPKRSSRSVFRLNVFNETRNPRERTVLQSQNTPQKLSFVKNSAYSFTSRVGTNRTIFSFLMWLPPGIDGLHFYSTNFAPSNLLFSARTIRNDHRYWRSRHVQAMNAQTKLSDVTALRCAAVRSAH